MSQESNSRRMRERVVVAFGSRTTGAFTRLTVGLGMVALVVSESHTGANYTSVWGVIRWAGFTLVVVSLPPVVYDTYQRYQRRRRNERSGSRSRPREDIANQHHAPKKEL